MKTLQELEEIRKKAQDKLVSHSSRPGTRIVVGMGTCGIAAGARPVLLEIIASVTESGMSDVVVAQTGCIGLCSMEPIVEVYKAGAEKVTYVKMTAEKARRIVQEHIVQNRAVEELTIGYHIEQES